MGIEKRKEILSQISELQNNYAGLSLIADDAEALLVRGKLTFSAQYDGVSIEDEYEVEITIPQDYPDILPAVKETGGKVPEEFHLNPDGTLCLGVPLEVKRKFRQNPCLLGFVEELLIPFLYSNSYKEKYGEMPFGELSHGTEGILEYYKEAFDVDDDYAVLGFLRILAENGYRGHMNCPCGSNTKLRDCHGKLLVEVKGYQNEGNYLAECYYVIYSMLQKGQDIPRSLIPTSILKKIRNVSKWKKLT